MNTLDHQPETDVITQAEAQTSPELFFATMHAFQRTAALKAALDLDLFTSLRAAPGTVTDLVEHLQASERGIRALCDFLVVIGFLYKDLNGTEARYSLTPDSAMYLAKQSPSYLGSATRFMASPEWLQMFTNLAAVVRHGGPLPNQRHFAQDHTCWQEFALGMAPMLYPVAHRTAGLLRLRSTAKVLDVAASHGLFGIQVALRNPGVRIVALDFAPVLAVAADNAARFGVADRYTLLPGDALVVPFGSGFDAVLVPNLLHHWDRATIVTFLRKVHQALVPDGKIVIVEFAPNDDRVSPPIPAAFVMNMLVSTPAGDAYTLSENIAMLEAAGFRGCESHRLPPTPQTAIVAIKI